MSDKSIQVSKLVTDEKASPPGDRRVHSRRREDGFTGVPADLKCCLVQIEPVGQELELWCWAACTEMIVGFLRDGGEGEDIRQGAQMNRRLGVGIFDCTLPKSYEGENLWSREEYDFCNGRGGWPHFYEFQNAVQSTKWSGRRHLLEERGLPLGEGGPRFRVGKRLTSRQLREVAYTSGQLVKQQLDQEEDYALSWDKLCEEFDAERPVFFSFRFPPGGGHMAVAAGYAITPGARRWVVVADPLPPGNGDVYLIPYDFYVSGPYGRHWRDYWIPTPENLSGNERIDDLEFGVDIVRAKPPPPRPRTPKVSGQKKDRERGGRLTQADIVASRPAAEEGFTAIRAIAEGAPEAAEALGLGNLVVILAGNFLESVIDLDLDEERAGRFAHASPRKLGLSDKPIPVYELFSSDLQEWGGGDVWELLRTPREVIWEVVRTDRELLPLYGAVTVRRQEGRWRLYSLGRAYLMLALARQQAKQVLSAGGWERLFSEGGFIHILESLGLLDPVLRRASDEEIRGSAAALGYPSKDVEKYLSEGRPRFEGERLERLLRLADALGPEVKEKPIEMRRPDFILDVKDLYQVFVASGDDSLVPVYPTTFYRPENRVEAGTAEEVLANLRRVVMGIGP